MTPELHPPRNPDSRRTAVAAAALEQGIAMQGGHDYDCEAIAKLVLHALHMHELAERDRMFPRDMEAEPKSVPGGAQP